MKFIKPSMYYCKLDILQRNNNQFQHTLLELGTLYKHIPHCQSDFETGQFQQSIRKNTYSCIQPYIYFIPDGVIVLTSAKCESYGDKQVFSLLHRLNKEVQEEKNEGSDHQNQPQALDALYRVVPACWQIRMSIIVYFFL